MPHLPPFKRIPCSEIKVNREQRQRSKIDTGHNQGLGSLEDSIRRLGLINPITVDRQLNLIAGERRLAACIKLGHASIPAHFLDDLDEIDRKLIELEENLKRADLHWKDQVRAVSDLHTLHLEQNSAWSQIDTARTIGMSPESVSQSLRIFRSLDNELVQKAEGWRAAFNILQRVDERKNSTILSSVREAATRVTGRMRAVLTGNGEVALEQLEPPPKPAEPPPSLIHANFLEWAPTYDGPRFNLIHCDFPYGIEFNAGPQGGRDKEAGRYDDTGPVYWTLLECLCSHLDRLMSTSAHLMFWFSMEHYTDTLAYFAAQAPSLQFLKQPLVWTKSDNVGILADPRRRPRNTYETCLMASREDRFIVKPVANFYSAPTDKRYHPSTKPEPMLRFFMQMFVDGTTRLLDPTCGSGSALRAAESLGAQQVLGLESDREYYESAQIALKSFRTLAAYHRSTT